MRIHLLAAPVVAWLCALACHAAVAQAAPPPDLPTRQLTHHEHHVIAADGKTVSTYRFATQVLKANAVEGAKQTTLSVSRSAQALQVLEAYTLKPGGKRLDVPKSSWQLRQDTGRDGNSPLYSDHSSTSLVFPDVAVGDTLVLAYRLSTREPLFPGKVSMQGTFARAAAFDDVRVVVDAPAAMPLKTQVFDMTESVATRPGRRITTWTFQNKSPAVQTRQDWSVYAVSSQPGYLLSSFEDWQDVARSYVSRATPKAAVTPPVRELATRLTAGKSDPRARVQALHEWVATQVNYAGNCVGIGAVVPRDLAVVLQHRIGDCKDHATLLQALLAAVGIESHQVLVNAGNLYRLEQVPVASLVNHVINYVPVLDLFIDATDSLAPLGRLPMQVYDKPVLAADPQVPAKTPPDAGGNLQVMRTRLALGEDGSAEGSVEVELGGLYALRARARLKDIDAERRARFVPEVFRAANLEAQGQFEHDDPAALNDRFRYRATFKIAQAIRYPGAGALPIAGWFYSEAPVSHFAQAAVIPAPEFDHVCSSAQVIEEYEITLPASMQVLAVPQGTAFNTALLGYEASYQLDGRVLKARRELHDRTPPTVCSPQIGRDFKAAAQGVLQDLRQQLLFK